MCNEPPCIVKKKKQKKRAASVAVSPAVLVEPEQRYGPGSMGGRDMRESPAVVRRNGNIAEGLERRAWQDGNITVGRQRLDSGRRRRSRAKDKDKGICDGAVGCGVVTCKKWWGRPGGRKCKMCEEK